MQVALHSRACLTYVLCFALRRAGLLRHRNASVLLAAWTLQQRRVCRGLHATSRGYGWREQQQYGLLLSFRPLLCASLKLHVPNALAVLPPPSLHFAARRPGCCLRYDIRSIIITGIQYNTSCFRRHPARYNNRCTVASLRRGSRGIASRISVSSICSRCCSSSCRGHGRSASAAKLAVEAVSVDAGSGYLRQVVAFKRARHAHSCFFCYIFTMGIRSQAVP